MKKSVIGLMLGIASFSTLSLVSAATKWSIQDVLNSWATNGIFKYVLPFLLVFALVFAIIDKSKMLGDNKGVHTIIALAIGLLSLVGDYFPNFIEKLAPNLAVGISVLLAAIILLGLFYNPKGEGGVKWLIYVFIGIGIIAFILIVSDTFSGYSGVGFNLWEDYGPALITLLIIGGIIAAVVAASKTKST